MSIISGWEAFQGGVLPAAAGNPCLGIDGQGRRFRRQGDRFVKGPGQAKIGRSRSVARCIEHPPEDHVAVALERQQVDIDHHGADADVEDLPLDMQGHLRIRRGLPCLGVGH